MRNKIINFFKQNPNQSFRIRQLAGILGVKKSAYRQFRQTLKLLMDEGKVARVHGNKYVLATIQNKKVGELAYNRRGFGFVMTGDEKDIFIASKNLMGAINGDVVEVLCLPSDPQKPEGKISKIIERKKDQFVGTVYFYKKTPYLEIEPVTPRRGIRIVDSNGLKLKAKDIVSVKVTDWGRSWESIRVAVIKFIGVIDNPADDMTYICHKYDLQPRFPDNVLNEVRHFNTKAIDDEIPKRLDLSSLKCITIDPEDARDFDDAISLDLDSKGNYVLGIHIADVSHFVRRGSELDREARNRGTSVYFGEGTVHMLPELLSADLCSLKYNENRLAVSVLLTLNKKFKVIDEAFHLSVVRIHHRFAYRQVQSILDGEHESEYSDMLKKLQSIAYSLLQQRQKLGSIDFDIPEPIFKFRGSGIPHEIIPSERLDSHRIVEECMLLANRVVAEKVPTVRDGKLPFIYRIHDKPPKSDVEKFLSVLRRFHFYQIENRELHPGEFRKILSSVEESPYKNLIETLALRTMTKAIYSSENRGHYGLAFPCYTHFTSPIRRYPDLVVHRLLKQYIIDKADRDEGVTISYLSKVASQSTNAEVQAMEAERDYIKLKQIRWLSQHIGEKFKGLISGIIKNGMFIELKDSLVEGFIHIEWLIDDYYVYDESDYSLIGKRYKFKYQLGDEIEIIVKDVNLKLGQANFKVVD